MAIRGTELIHIFLICERVKSNINLHINSQRNLKNFLKNYSQSLPYIINYFRLNSWREKNLTIIQKFEQKQQQTAIDDGDEDDKMVICI